MQTKQRLTSDDGERLIAAPIENSEISAQPSDKKKKRGALIWRNPIIWRVMLIQPIVIYSLFLFSFTFVWQSPYLDSIASLFVVFLFASVLISLAASIHFWSRRRLVAVGFIAGSVLTWLIPLGLIGILII